jgi:hypothetical protein
VNRVPKHAKLSQGRSGAPPERGGFSKRQRLATADVDAQVLALRQDGNSYSAIARTLELARATDAHRSFLRALGTREGAERQRLIEDEEVRLDRLEERIRDRDVGEPDKVKRRLLGVDKFREAIRPRSTTQQQ